MARDTKHWPGAKTNYEQPAVSLLPPVAAIVQSTSHKRIDSSLSASRASAFLQEPRNSAVEALEARQIASAQPIGAPGEFRGAERDGGTSHWGAQIYGRACPRLRQGACARSLRLIAVGTRKEVGKWKECLDFCPERGTRAKFDPRRKELRGRCQKSEKPARRGSKGRWARVQSPIFLTEVPGSIHCATLAELLETRRAAVRKFTG
ncbi:hypothetical protein KM043_005493 [Ampulex compressa]|nr:hypothetical protein KM043_005493 [Ampulex compressa]